MNSCYDTYCGLYCGACPVLRANEENRVAEQAAEWKTQPEEITCHGCKSDVLSGYCRTCEIKACAIGRHVEFCFDCAEYPRDRLIAFRDDEWPLHSCGANVVSSRNEEKQIMESQSQGGS